jgi:CRISPR/Cas system-associated endonuclease Cas1
VEVEIFWANQRLHPLFEERHCIEIVRLSLYCFRWKERYFVLTKDYIHCFKKEIDINSEIVPLLLQVEVEIFWANQRLYPLFEERHCIEIV